MLYGKKLLKIVEKRLVLKFVAVKSVEIAKFVVTGNTAVQPERHNTKNSNRKCELLQRLSKFPRADWLVPSL